MSDNKITNGKQATSEQFRIAIKELKKKIRTARLEQLKKKSIISKEFDAKIDLIRQEKNIVQNKYLVDNPFGILAYVDRIEAGNSVFRYDEPLQITYETRSQQYAKRLKNGQIRYYTRNVKCIVFNKDEMSTAFAVDAKVSEIKQVIKLLYQIIDDYPESKNKLDAELLTLDKKLAKHTSDKEKQIIKNNDLYSTKISEYKKAIKKAMSGATPLQLKELNKRRNIFIIACLVVAMAVIVPIVISKISNAIIMNIERGRDYYVNISDEFQLECNAGVDDNSQVFRCAEREIDGSFSAYNSVNLESSQLSQVDINEGNFKIKLPQIEIPFSEFEMENYDIDTIQRKFGETTQYIALYNQVLKDRVLEKVVVIHWNFTESDKNMFIEKNKEWNKKEQERKAKEEEKKREKEAAERAEIERKQGECVANGAYYSWDGANCNYNPPPATSNVAPSNPSNPSSSPNSGVTDVVSGYCNDGTYVTGNPSAKGRANACYGHKGWRDY